MWIVVFCVVMPRSFAGGYQHFRGTYRLQRYIPHNLADYNPYFLRRKNFKRHTKIILEALETLLERRACYCSSSQN
jgi:hypothetical protein